jgi:nucleotide-binding universal stress UspA family protein
VENPHATDAVSTMRAPSPSPKLELRKGGSMKRILIATDGSQSAAEAVDVGLELARDEGAEVTFVHVVRPDEWEHGARGTPLRPIVHPVAIDERETALSAAATAADRAGVPSDRVLVAGDTVEVILDAAEQADADLIVVGSRGLNAVRSVLLGSTSLALLRRATCGVLVVRGARAGAR